MSELQSPYRADILDGKVALITGGGSGIGLEIARQLGLHGASVMIMGRREAVLEQAKQMLSAQGIAVRSVAGDVRSEASGEAAVGAAVREFGRLDILVNSAAGNFLATASDLSTNAFRTVMDIDTVGTFNMCRAALQPLQDTRGLVLNITATIQYPATWWQAHASAAKCAIDSLTRSLALEWGEYGVRVNAVAPGPIADTVGMQKLAPTAAAAANAFTQAVPLKDATCQRWDCAMAALYYASPAGRVITGDTIVVDGGQQLWRPPLLPRAAVAKASRGVEAKMKAPKSKL